MPFLIGTDEAGYGPNLGPLVISATLWQVPDDWGDRCLYEALHGLVFAGGGPRSQRTGLVIADSKVLYNPSSGLSRLESNLLPALNAAGKTPETWRQIWEQLVPGAEQRFHRIPWYREYDCPLPMVTHATRLHRHEDTFQKIEQLGVRLLAVRSAAAFPAEFNAAVRAADSKGAVLSQLTLELVAGLLASLPEVAVLIHCDKHGGRNKYLPVLQTAFPDHPIRVQRESRDISQYCWGPPDRQTTIRFVAKGERFLPAALASMASKYLRELAMAAFNEFWIAHCPDLKPTAGYPVDAKRFKQEIAATQQRLGIPDEMLWRER